MRSKVSIPVGRLDGHGNARKSRFTRSRACSGRVTTLFVFVVALMIGVIAGAGNAQAQAVDWVTNIDDAGYDPMPAGGVVKYNITVFNNGTGPAPATTLDITLPANTTLSGTSGTIGPCTQNGQLLSCDVPPLAVDGLASLEVDVATSDDGLITLGAEVQTQPGEPSGSVGNNSDSETTTINAGADIGMGISGPASAAAGDDVTYTFTATNLGPDPATNVAVNFPVPTGFVNVSPPAGCTVSGGEYLCTIAGPLGVGDSVDLDFDGQISVAAGSTLTPVGSVVGSDPGDPISSNNTAQMNTTVTAGSDLTITKNRAPAGSLLVGDNVNFTLSPRYTGDTPSGITVSDIVPTNYQIDTITAPGWDCSASVGQDVICNMTSGSGAGANVSLGDIIIETTVLSPGSPVNSADITAAGPVDPDLTNNTSTDGGATIDPPEIDLRANKRGPSPALMVVGNDYEYRISTTNVGNTDFDGTIVMEDTLPSGLTYTGVSGSGWICTPSAPPSVAGPVNVTCERDYTAAAPLAPGASTPVAILETTVTGTGTIVNSLTVSAVNSNLPDNNQPNNTITYSTGSSVGPDAADVRVVKTASLASVDAGDVQEFSIEVFNDGPSLAEDVELIDNLTNLMNNAVGATGAGLVSVSSPAGVSCSTTSSGGFSRRLTCDIPSLANGDSRIINVQVRPGRNGGTRSNTAEAISDTTADPNLSNNSGSASYDVVSRADINVTKVASPDPAVAGQNLTYVVVARNISVGLSAAQNVTISDTLPADVTFVSASPSQGSCATQPVAGTTTDGTDQVVCNLGTIASDAQQTVSIIVRPNSVTRGSTLINDVSVSTTTNETDGSNNSASVSTDVSNPMLDLLVNKRDSVDPVAVGNDTTYTVTITNSGPSAAENVVMTDTMPTAGLTYQSHTIPADGSCSTVPASGSTGGTLSCSFPVIPAGQSRIVEIIARGSQKGSYTNDVQVESTESLAGFDSRPGNNQADEATTVRTRADVEVVSKVASVDPINLREDFDFTIRVRNNTGALLDEADDVEVSDTLPSGMVLTGTPTVSLVSGSISISTCTGAAGASAFSCDLGTMSSGAEVDIVAPVELRSVASLPQTFTNTASVSTSSLDVDTSNNSNSGTVAVNSSSISGTVFRDFGDDGDIDTGDSGLAGVPVQLTGTSFDGASISLNTTTNGNGDFNFPFIPQGDYTITRGTPGEQHLSDGIDTVGSEGGSLAGPDAISSISLPSNTAATDYLFAMVPTARVGIAKRVTSGPVANPDGSFNATFRLEVENFSLEDLQDVSVEDALAGGAPAFGTFAALGAPASDPLSQGQYTILSGPSGTCNGVNGGFNGSGDRSLVSGGSLSAGSTCTIDFSLRVRPTAPLPGGGYLNQASIAGEGVLSGQPVQDDSDNGANPDPNGNGIADESGENDPTPVNPAFNPAIALIKTADTSALSSPPQPGEEIDYSFTITNTGDVTLDNVNLTDSLPDIVLTGGPIASLAPGASDSTTFSATYALKQSDIDSGTVQNQATTSGTDPYGTVVTDDSGTNNSNDTPLVTPVGQTASIALIKSADSSALSNPAVVGEVINYSFTVTNTGNVTLSNVSLTDALAGAVLSGGPIASMQPGAVDSSTFTATYALTQADIDNGRVENLATVTGTPPSGGDVSDDSGTDNASDTPTVVPVSQGANITIDKVADTSGIVNGAVVGDVIPYSFTVTNTGNVTLTNVTVSDPLPGLVLNGGPIASLAPGAVDSTTYTANYTVTQADLDAGQVDNTATATGEYGDDGTGSPLTVSDSDTETADVVAIEAAPEIFPPFTSDGGTTTSMLASDTVRGVPADLSNVTITVDTSDPEVTLDPATGLITLSPGNPAGDYTVTYEICSVLVPTACDTATETVTQAPITAIEATKTLSLADNGDGRDGVGDTVTFTITVENTGNVIIDTLDLDDTFTAMDGRPLTLDSGPDWVSADAGSPEGELQIGETATYTASFVLTIDAVNGGGVSNTVTAEGLPVFPPTWPDPPTPVDDVSDDGDDTDDNTTDDPTELPVSPSLLPTGLTVEKTTLRGLVERGSIVPYTITVRNDNPVVAGVLDIVDVLPAGFLYQPDSATLEGNPADVDVAGRVITWRDVPVPPLTTITATVSARVTTGTQPGEHVNRASIRNPATTGLLAPVASATVRIMPEPVFDCGDVIGKVFNDRNRDGYQNPPPEGASEEEVEEGIAAARVVGVDGTIITADQFGRFHVPCAMLPEDRGSNFILKLDTRSLPSGFRVTTENPRVVRLTPGKMTEVNFGAAISRVVRIDLNASAFESDGAGKARLTGALEHGITQLLPRIAGEPVSLRLAYHLPNTADSTEKREARALMDLVETHIRKAWRDVGRVKLTIEQTLVRTAQ